MDWRRLDLEAIEAALAALGAAEASERLSAELAEEPLVDDALRRLMSGYRYVDELLAARNDIFRYGESRHILELNHLVLCGASPERRLQFQKHLRETERRFYERPGIDDFMEWYKRNRGRAPRALASGIFLRVLSAPQLFIEGNSRTATLLVSYALARAGQAPLVVTECSFRTYVEMVERCVGVDRTTFSSLFTAATVGYRLNLFLAQNCEERFLAPSENSEARQGVGPVGAR